MCPSTEFATAVLRNLLRRIEQHNANQPRPYFVSHAWTDGPMMYLVYTAPPSDITRGLARDTDRSLIDPGPWLSVDDPALYYYLLHLEESQVSTSFRHPGEPETILWSGDPIEDSPAHPSDIPEAFRYTPAPVPPDPARSADRSARPEPRRYADPH